MNRRAPFPLLMMLALALLARVLVPNGWMPADGGGLAFVPCPAAGPVAAKPMPMHHGGDHEQSGHDGKVAGDCAFALLLAAGALPAPLALPPAPVTVPAPPPSLARSPLRTGAAHHLPPATGPPALA